MEETGGNLRMDLRDLSLCGCQLADVGFIMRVLSRQVAKGRTRQCLHARGVSQEGVRGVVRYHASQRRAPRPSVGGGGTLPPWTSAARR